MAHTRYTFCRTCEATCALEVDVEEQRHRDPAGPSSRGQQGLFLRQGHTLRPGPAQPGPGHGAAEARRRPLGMHSWDQAIDEIGARIRTIVARDGADAIAHLVGSAGGANLLAPMFRNAFYKALGSRTKVIHLGHDRGVDESSRPRSARGARRCRRGLLVPGRPHGVLPLPGRSPRRARRCGRARLRRRRRHLHRAGDRGARTATGWRGSSVRRTAGGLGLEG